MVASSLRRGWWSMFAVALALVQPALAQEEDENKIPKPEDVVLLTKDNLELHCTYYGGTKKKESVPLVLVHDYKGNRHDWDDLALAFQQTQGYAVIVPDLRGHGDSTNFKDSSNKLEAEDMPLVQYPLMYRNDLETVKKFLMDKNNAGKLNIDKLSVCGAGMGALVGMLWTAQDYAWPVLATGKQGQDVKAVAMLSPVFAFKGLNMQEINSPSYGRNELLSRVSIYVAVGMRDTKSAAEAKRVFNLFKPYHSSRNRDPKDQDIFFDSTMMTKLEGTKLLGEKSLGLPARLTEFFDFRVASQTFPWAERKVEF